MAVDGEKFFSLNLASCAKLFFPAEICIRCIFEQHFDCRMLSKRKNFQNCLIFLPCTCADTRAASASRSQGTWGEIELNVKEYGNSNDGVISILPQRRPVAMMGEGEGVKGPVVALLEKTKIKINFPARCVIEKYSIVFNLVLFAPHI